MVTKQKTSEPPQPAGPVSNPVSTSALPQTTPPVPAVPANPPVREEPSTG